MTAPRSATDETPAPKDTGLTPITPLSTGSFPWAKTLLWTATTALALTAIWLASHNYSLRQQNQIFQTERELAQLANQTAQARLAQRTIFAETMINELGNQWRESADLSRLKFFSLTSPVSPSQEAPVIVIWDPAQQTGWLSLEKLPAITATQDYQIWIMDPAYPDPVSGGVFHPEASGKVALPFKPEQPITQATACTISLERRGGVPKAEGPILLLSK